MTKEGFKQILVGIDTWGMLKKQSIKQKISINKVIQGLFIAPSKLITRVQIPIGAYPFSIGNKTEKYHTQDFRTFLQIQQSLTKLGCAGI